MAFGTYTVYQVGVRQGYVLGADASGLEPAEIAPEARAYPYRPGFGYGYGISPFFWGFGFFFKCLFGLFFFMMISKIFFWGFGGRRWGRHGNWRHKHWKHHGKDDEASESEMPEGTDA